MESFEGPLNRGGDLQRIEHYEVHTAIKGNDTNHCQYRRQHAGHAELSLSQFQAKIDLHFSMSLAPLLWYLRVVNAYAELSRR